MSDEQADPRRIRSLAVHKQDVLTAFEAQARDRKPAVLRVVAPVSGRMRARLHVAREAPDSMELHLHPETFVDDPPSFPHVDDTADELHEAGEYDLDRHREAHQRAVAAWRERVGERLRERITIPTEFGTASNDSGTADGSHEVTVAYLG